MEKKEIKVCKHCVMDTTDTKLVLDENGVCDRCHDYEERVLPWWNHGKGHEEELKKLIADIKKSGEGKKYDCLLGMSGGLDSSYMLHMAIKEWGLRPFVFHIDAGWDLPVTVENLRKLKEGLGVEIHNEVMDWEEMRKMQIIFFKAGIGLDVPQDHAFVAMVDHFADKMGIKYILNGFNVATEAVADPESWSEGGGSASDQTYVKDVIRRNGDGWMPKHYVWTSGFKHKFWLPYVKGVKTVTPLNLMPITRQQMIDTLHNEYGYEPYGQKHFEDEITKFIEGYWMPKRYGQDIRIAWNSSLIMTGQMTREEALKQMEQPPMTEEEGQQMFKDIAKKLQIREEELQSYFEKGYDGHKYRTSNWAYKIGIKIYQTLGLDHRIRK